MWTGSIRSGRSEDCQARILHLAAYEGYSPADSFKSTASSNYYAYLATPGAIVAPTEGVHPCSAADAVACGREILNKTSLLQAFGTDI